MKSGLIFLETCYLCVFYSFYNKYACFVTCKNYFCVLLVLKSTNWRFVLRLIIFCCCFSCFKILDLLDRQIAQFDFSVSTLFVIFTFCGLKLSVYSLHPKQYVVPGFFQALLVLFLIVCFSFFVIWQYFLDNPF